MGKMHFWCVLSFGMFFGSLLTIGCGGGGGAPAIAQTVVNAIDVAFDNSTNGMTSTEVQTAIEELNAKIALLESANATTATTVASLLNENTQLAARVIALESAAASAATTVANIEAKTSAMSVSGDELYFTGVNVNIRNGQGRTNTANSLGNLIVGYNRSSSDTRSGSHNLVVGDYHSYSSYGGLVAGNDNTISASHACVSGGYFNIASGIYSSVGGGIGNEATGVGCSVSGGTENKATGDCDSVSGGYENRASGIAASVSGGCNNTSDKYSSAVGGGVSLHTSSDYQFLPN